jgi:hemerythrin-like metal-binding protein
MNESEINVAQISFETGIEVIDSQHRILINTLNRAFKKLGDDISGEVSRQITLDLLSYALYHFETEEDLMKRYDYELDDPEAASEHIRQHREFSVQVVALRSKTNADESESHAFLLRFLKDWLVNHICNTDQRLARFIKDKDTSGN